MLTQRQSVCRRPAESHDRAGVYRESRVARRLAQCANSGSGRRGTTVRFGSTDGGDTTATTAEGRVLTGLRAGARDGDTPVRQSDNRHRRVEASLHARAHATAVWAVGRWRSCRTGDDAGGQSGGVLPARQSGVVDVPAGWRRENRPTISDTQACTRDGVVGRTTRRQAERESHDGPDSGYCRPLMCG
jgi:hypothetical protein